MREVAPPEAALAVPVTQLWRSLSPGRSELNAVEIVLEGADRQTCGGN